MPDPGYWGTTKPPRGTAIDPAHPLARGLVAYWPLGSGGGGAQDIWGNYHLITAALGGSPVDGVGLHGGPVTVLRGTPEQLYSIPVNDPIGGLTAATMTGWFFRAATNQSAVMGWCPNTSFRFFLTWFTDSNVYAVVENGVTAGRNVALAGIGWHHFVLSYDGSRAAADRALIYIDGVLQTTAVVANNPAASLGTATQLANYSIGYDFSDNQYAVGSAEDCAVWSRALSADDALSLYAQPYAMFVPPVWRRMFVPTAVVTARQRRTSVHLGARVGSRQAI